MTDHTFAVRGLADACVHCTRAAADAAFNIPGVRAVGIDRAVGLLTVTSARRIGVAEFATAVDEAGFDLAHGPLKQHMRAS